ncbi:MAG TPA: ScpA family protein [Hyphomicrobiales bacterium]|nr:ScpA family protein [Hyphomicrobiales bacterium]
MTASGNEDLWTEAAADEARASADPTFVIDVAGFEGPLDLLLTLARNQKVDLARISILALAEQYLAFIENLRKLRLEVAADYLVMAAWLAYLKSRLLLPEPPGDEEPSGEELAAMLAFRLQRLEAVRAVAARLFSRDRLGRDAFARGAPEPLEVRREQSHADTLYDLLKAYGALRQRTIVSSVHVRRRPVLALPEARDILMRLVGTAADWVPIDVFLADYLAEAPEGRVSVLASSFSASLELVREGVAELRQSEAFGRLYLRRRAEDKNGADNGTSGAAT